MSADRLAERIVRARQRVEHLEGQLAGATRAAQAAFPDDPGALSGIRRKPNHRADARRHTAYSREADLNRALIGAKQHLDALIRRERMDAEDAAAKARIDMSAVTPGGVVRTSTGWHRVVRVNARTVTVETPYSWTDRLPLTSILDARSPAAPAEGTET